jgi:hypothetical protein
MKSRIVGTALVCLFSFSSAYAVTRDLTPAPDRPFAKIIKVLKRIVGISPNDDLSTPKP